MVISEQKCTKIYACIKYIHINIYYTHIYTPITAIYKPFVIEPQPNNSVHIIGADDTIISYRECIHVACINVCTIFYKPIYEIIEK